MEEDKKEEQLAQNEPEQAEAGSAEQKQEPKQEQKAEQSESKKEAAQSSVDERTQKKIICALAYVFGILFFLPLIVYPNDDFAKFHANQALVVLLTVIIGEVLFGTRSFKNCLISVVLGSIVYRLVIAIVLELGMPPNDLKLFTAILVAIALSLPLIQSKLRAASRLTGRAS